MLSTAGSSCECILLTESAAQRDDASRGPATRADDEPVPSTDSGCQACSQFLWSTRVCGVTPIRFQGVDSVRSSGRCRCAPVRRQAPPRAPQVKSSRSSTSTDPYPWPRRIRWVLHRWDTRRPAFPKVLQPGDRHPRSQPSARESSKTIGNRHQATGSSAICRRLGHGGFSRCSGTGSQDRYGDCVPDA
jgi:hypothetical protein